MADKKISELDAIAGADTAADDFFVVVDTSGSVTKKISRAELNNAIEQDVLSTVDINGGTIDNTVIGGTTAAAGSFTNVTVSGTVDGRDVASDGTKLDGIEASATADQTGAQIKTAYEAQSNTNAFTDALQTKLNGIETSADVTDATNVAAAGALMTSGGTVTGDINFGDGDKSVFGAGSDLQIYHDGTDSVIKDTGNGNLVLTSNGGGIFLRNNAETETYANFNNNGSVQLRYDNSAKFETTSTGVDVTGVITTDGMTTSADINFGDNDRAIFGAGSDLQIYHDGSDSWISDAAGLGNLYIRSNDLIIMNAPNNETLLRASQDGAVTAYYNGSPKLATTSTGVDVTGNLTATGNVTAYSDERLKSDITTIDNALDKVTAMRGVTFTKDGEAGSGVVAQELEKIAPELVMEGEEYKSVAYGNLVGYLIEAVKELSAKVEELENGSSK